MPARNRIGKIGLEVEGAWISQPHGMKRDGSVTGSFAAPHVGEMASAPIATLDEAETWLRNYYPQEVNSTCGFHVHVSLNNLYYSRLICDDFNMKFLSAMEEFYSRFRGEPSFDRFRQRLDGQNRYCQKRFQPEEQLWRMEAYGDHDRTPRYRQLNYCYGRHGTLECRLFPCFESVTHSIEGMKAFIGSINEFLATCSPEKAFVVDVPVPPETPPSFTSE